DLAGGAGMRRAGFPAAFGAIRHERGPLDTVRRSHYRIRFSRQAPHHRERDPKSLCGDEPELHVPDQPPVDGDLPDRQGELFQRVRRGHAPGRCDGAAAVRSERKMSMTKYKTAESVRRGHPDKLCDLIADSILDECLRRDRYSRCACEVMVTKGKIFVCGEITCAAKIN